MSTKVEPTLAERIAKHTATPAEAKRLCKLLEGKGFMDLTLEQLLTIPGMGRKGALVVIQVACDIKGKK